MKLTALVVDDEHSGRVSIKILLTEQEDSLFEKVVMVPSLEEAMEQVAQEQFDLCFLDVDLGNHSGFDLLPSLPEHTKVIFVTAYSEYAIKAIREKAFDYLLKPINPVELSACIERYKKESSIEESNKFLLIKDQGFTIPILLEDIHYIEANGPYSKIFLSNMDYTTSKTLKTITSLAGKDFVRIHKSYTVNRNIIKSFKKDTIITMTNICLPVSRIGAKLLSQYF